MDLEQVVSVYELACLVKTRAVAGERRVYHDTIVSAKRGLIREQWDAADPCRYRRHRQPHPDHTSATSYATARNKVLASAQELYGVGSREAKAVQRAYAAINVRADIAE